MLAHEVLNALHVCTYVAPSFGHFFHVVFAVISLTVQTRVENSDFQTPRGVKDEPQGVFKSRKVFLTSVFERDFSNEPVFCEKVKHKAGLIYISSDFQTFSTIFLFCTCFMNYI